MLAEYTGLLYSDTYATILAGKRWYAVLAVILELDSGRVLKPTSLPGLRMVALRYRWGGGLC